MHTDTARRRWGMAGRGRGHRPPRGASRQHVQLQGHRHGRPRPRPAPPGADTALEVPSEGQPTGVSRVARCITLGQLVGQRWCGPCHPAPGRRVCQYGHTQRAKSRVSAHGCRCVCAPRCVSAECIYLMAGCSSLPRTKPERCGDLCLTPADRVGYLFSLSLLNYVSVSCARHKWPPSCPFCPALTRRDRDEASGLSGRPGQARGPFVPVL